MLLWHIADERIITTLQFDEAITGADFRPLPSTDQLVVSLANGQFHAINPATGIISTLSYEAEPGAMLHGFDLSGDTMYVQIGETCPHYFSEPDDPIPQLRFINLTTGKEAIYSACNDSYISVG